MRAEIPVERATSQAIIKGIMRKAFYWALPLILLLVAFQLNAGTKLLISGTGTGTSSVVAPPRAPRSFQAVGVQSGTGAGAASIKVEGSNVNSTNNNDWVTLQDIPLVLTTTSTGSGFSSTAPYEFVRARVMSISGTGSTVSVYVGY